MTDEYDALHKDEKLINLVNMVDFHTRAVDAVESLLHDACALGDVYFYKAAFLNVFATGWKTPAQYRFLPAMAAMCDMFADAGSDAYPSERLDVGKDSANLGNHFLKKTTELAINKIRELAIEHIKLGDQLLPINAADFLSDKGTSPQKSVKGKK